MSVLPTPPAIKINNGTLEALKWLAMIAMTIDHYNRFFWNTSSYTALSIGRLAMPLFAFIFAYNLARPEAFSQGIYHRVITRLIIFGLLATPAYMSMRALTQIWPLNIMFSFCLTAIILYLYEKKIKISLAFAIIVFLIGGIFVEFAWQGIAFCLMCWTYCRKPSLLSLLAACFFCYMIATLNGNEWALMSLPLIALATQIKLAMPRIPYLFYVYYPLHLSLFALYKNYIAI